MLGHEEVGVYTLRQLEGNLTFAYVSLSITRLGAEQHAQLGRSRSSYDDRQLFLSTNGGLEKPSALVHQGRVYTFDPEIKRWFPKREDASSLAAYAMGQKESRHGLLPEHLSGSRFNLWGMTSYAGSSGASVRYTADAASPLFDGSAQPHDIEPKVRDVYSKLVCAGLPQDLRLISLVWHTSDGRVRLATRPYAKVEGTDPLTKTPTQPHHRMVIATTMKHPAEK